MTLSIDTMPQIYWYTLWNTQVTDFPNYREISIILHYRVLAQANKFNEP